MKQLFLHGIGGPVSGLVVDLFAGGYGQVRTELMAMTAAGEAKHYPDLECWTIPESTPIEPRKPT